MAFTVDFATRIVYSDANINDFPAARAALRALEETEFGKVNPKIFDFSKIALGGGAYMYDITFVHGYTLEFPGVGAFAINGGNWNSTINDSGVQVIVTKAAAYAVTASGGSALTPDEHNKLMALPAATDVASSVGARVIEGSLTADQVERIKLAALAGKRQGLGTATEQYMAQNGTTPRITLTPDANGNGLPVLDGSP